MHVVCKKNPTIYFLWTFSMKANCFGNFAKKQSSVEIVQKSELLWKLSNKAKFYGNIPTKQFLVEICLTKLHIFVEIFWQISVYFDGILPTKHCETWKEFCNKTAWKFVKISTKSIKLPKFPRSNAATLQGFLWLWNWA